MASYGGARWHENTGSMWAFEVCIYRAPAPKVFKLFRQLFKWKKYMLEMYIKYCSTSYT